MPFRPTTADVRVGAPASEKSTAAHARTQGKRRCNSLCRRSIPRSLLEGHCRLPSSCFLCSTLESRWLSPMAVVARAVPASSSHTLAIAQLAARQLQRRDDRRINSNHFNITSGEQGWDQCPKKGWRMQTSSPSSRPWIRSGSIRCTPLGSLPRQPERRAATRGSRSSSTTTASRRDRTPSPRAARAAVAPA